MNDKLADLRHAQLQRDWARKLSHDYGFSNPQPLSPPSRSRALVQETWDEAREARSRGEVTTERFAALGDLLQKLGTLGICDNPSEYIWMLVASDGVETGFFEGPLTAEGLSSWFSAGQDSAALRGIHSTTRHLLDRVVDDPTFGSFYELETWTGRVV